MLIAAALIAQTLIPFSTPRSYRAETTVRYPSAPSEHFVKAFNGVDQMQVLNDSPAAESPNIVWRDGKQFQLIGGRWYVRDLGMAPIISADGKHLVYSAMPKLTTDLTYPHVTNIRGAVSQLPDAVIDGIRCHVFQIAQKGTRRTETLWIGTDDHYVHRDERIFDAFFGGHFVQVDEVTNFTMLDKPITLTTPSSPIPADHCLLRFENSTPVKAVQPDFPKSALGLKLDGAINVSVRFTVGQDGAVADATVVQSSGVMAIDDAALKAAKVTTFASPAFLCPGIIPTAVYQYVFRNSI